MKLEGESCLDVVLGLKVHLENEQFMTHHVRENNCWRLTLTSWWTYLMYISSRPIRRMKFIRRSYRMRVSLGPFGREAKTYGSDDPVICVLLALW